MEKEEFLRIKKMHSAAVHEINNGEYIRALNITYEIKNTFKPSLYVSNVTGCLLIDIGRILKKEEITHEGIELIKTDFHLIKNNLKNPSNVYYNLANGYYNLFCFKWDKEPYFNCFKETELDKVKINLRKALEYDSNNPEILVNLANCYDHLGRTIDALDCYEKALEIKPNHPMALGNKGIALCRYSFLLGKKFRTILLDAHYFISNALEKGVLPESEESFKIWLKWIENQFKDKNVLKKSPSFPGYSIEAKSEFNRYIKEFTMKNKLYLNVCSFCQKCNASIGDTIIISAQNNNPIKTNHYRRLSAYLDQIKEDYISARFLLTLSEYKNLKLDFIYEDAQFDDKWENPHNINLQFLKLSFKNFYDVLDKIAFFINDYLNLKIKPIWLIDFRKIWYSKWKREPSMSIINDEIVKTNSYGLNALFDIHWDFEKEGPYNNLRETRNALTHRYIKLSFNEEIEIKTFLEQTLELARIVRNAIFYLMYFVNEIESRKQKDGYNES